MRQNRNTILIVDDMSSNRLFLKAVLGDGYQYLEAENGKVALELMQRYHSKIAVTLLDVMMPVKDGFQVLEELRGSPMLQEFPILVITSDSGKKSELRVLDLGASDVIIKPYDPAVVKRRIALMIELFAGRRTLESKVDDLYEMLNSVNNSIVNTLATVTEFRSLESGQHVVRIRKFAKILLQALAKLYPDYALTERKIEMIASASVLHDVGKVQIPDHILNKPGKLTEEEFEIMKVHTTAGADILRAMSGVLDEDYMHYAHNICRYHHERWDGAGYPDGLRQHNIPICAQVVAICDVYDALTTPRVYKAAFSHETAVKMIIDGECGQFNPEIIKAFGSVLGEFRQCAKDYADNGVIINAEEELPLIPAPRAEEVGATGSQLTEKRWRALCQAVDGVIFEVDLNDDSYRVLHDSDRVFENFRISRKLNEMLMELLNKAVHPEDKITAAEQILCLQREFFDEGLRYHTKKLRIHNSKDGEYYWIKSNVLRVNTNYVTDRKALCVWQKVYEKDAMLHPKEKEFRTTWDDKILSKMPWTTLRCRQDKSLTMEEGMPLLADLLGYSTEELEQVSGGSLVNLMFEEDRERAISALLKDVEGRAETEVEYRLRHKNGDAVYVIDNSSIFVASDGMEHTYKALLNVTEIRSEQEQVRSMEDRYRMLMEHADEIFFVWDMEKDEVEFADNFRKTFGYEVPKEDFGKRLVGGGGLIHAEDIPVWNALVKDIELGTPSQQEMRILRADGSHIWCRIRVVGQQHGNGKTSEIVGAITNINTDKMMVQNLRQAAESDALTGLCNAAAAKKLVETYLRGLEGKIETAALIIMDLDNFKLVNDRHGHLMGDAVLMGCGEMLKRRFRPYDVIARMGGDEFMILVCDVPDREAVEKICEDTLRRFRAQIASKVPDCNVSCSLGVAMIPDEGTEMERLISCADAALRFAKGLGKDRVSFYSDVKSEEVVYESDRTTIDSDERGNIGNRSLMEHTLHMLYHAENVDEAIQAVLTMAARQANVSRACIFENLPDNRFCRNSFEWCSSGVLEMKEMRQRISYDGELRGWQDMFDGSGVFCCGDTQELPQQIRALTYDVGVCALLACAIVDGGEFRGFIVFECNYDKREWTQEQVGYLTSVAEALSVFLLRKRSQESADACAAVLQHMMTSEDGWVQVLRGEDYGLRYLNDPAGKIPRMWEQGVPCYRALMGRDTPCETCPIKQPGEWMELECPALGKTIRAKAICSSWEGENVSLLLCGDGAEEAANLPLNE